MTPILLLCLQLTGSPLATDSVPLPTPPSLWDRYEDASTYGGVGAGIGGVAFALAYRDFGAVPMVTAGIGGAVLGATLGIAWGANTRSAWDEAHGSFLVDVLGTVGGAVVGAYAGYLVGGIILGDREGANGLPLLGLFTAPLGAVLAQKLVAGEQAPSVSLWTPEGSLRGPVGFCMNWILP